ncbi:hypothetical protein TSUD_300380 [Trifolium subterraneum]|uniref:Uncharacterized protein n=1 Tax=Trifolium subterraneum TaxID=3900 RepID=A0A2Z6PHV8_TRISU|nr:hypothetical protein TSUD_300380 [Trifolium subterraneum]
MNQMNWCEFEASRVRCKEHPNDKQLPGVCSSCLRDKLSQLYTKNPIESLYYCSPSSPATPQAIDDGSTNHGSSRSRRFRRNASHATGSASCMISFNNALNLKKSKSLAVVSRNRVRDRDVVGGGRGRKKDGFWSKVLKLRRKDAEETVVNSRT